MKNMKKCPKCGSTKIGHVDWLPTYSDSESLGQQCIGTTLAKKPKWTLGTPRDAHVIEAYVCTSCGFLEYYAKQRETIPVDQIESFRWIS
jgi:predicted nucleic-acid-binding Zn-ribbon protein